MALTMLHIAPLPSNEAALPGESTESTRNVGGAIAQRCGAHWTNARNNGPPLIEPLPPEDVIVGS